MIRHRTSSQRLNLTWNLRGKVFDLAAEHLDRAFDDLARLRRRPAGLKVAQAQVDATARIRKEVSCG